MFYAPGFDPYLIIYQILCVQALMYLDLGLWVCILAALAGTPMHAVSLRQLFSHSAVQLGLATGWIPFTAYIINAGVGCALAASGAPVRAVPVRAPLTPCARPTPPRPVGPHSALILCVIVERAKKCLDFAATFHLMHLLLCWQHGGFPSSWEWWALNGGSLVGMALLGEYLCMKRELQDIPLFGSQRGTRESESESGAGLYSRVGRRLADQRRHASDSM